MLPPKPLLDGLLATARYGCSSLLLSQSSGGNNSVKSANDDLLWVKASGINLAEMNDGNGIVAVRNSTLRSLVRESAPSVGDRRARHEESVRRTQAAALDPSQGRPSLETAFHALFPETFVLHLHPVYTNAFACMRDGRAALESIAPAPFAWVPYVAPGQELAVELDRAVSAITHGRSASPAVVLQNHGFIAPGASPDDCIALTGRFLEASERFFGPLAADLYSAEAPSQELQSAASRIERHIASLAAEGRTVRPARFSAYREFCRDPRLASQPGPLVPDDVVYSGYGLRLTSLDAALAALQTVPDKAAIALEGLGVVLIARNERLAVAMEETLLAHVLVRMLIARRGVPSPLPATEIDYLQGMESEKYRIKVTSKA